MPLHRRHSMAALLGAGVLVTCSAMNPYYDPNKPHHRPEGFQNIDERAWMPRAAGEFFRWQRERLGKTIAAPSLDLTALTPDLAQLRANRRAFTATWIGHSTMLVQLAGLNILTDPHFSRRASPVQWAGPQRWQPPAIALADLPRIDLVLISHNHYDHLDADTVVALNAQAGGPPLFVVPLGLERWLQAAGIDHVRALDWWDATEFQGARVHLTPVQHWSRRTLADTNTTLWGGFVLEAGNRKVYFAGDTGYSDRHFKETGERFGPIDLALIPIGAYEPRWFMAAQHVNPVEAVQIHRDVRAKLSIGIHWGTFQLTDEPIDQAVRDLIQARAAAGVADDAFIVLRHGQTRAVP